jgi:uncharacterized membrane protein YkgB
LRKRAAEEREGRAWPSRVLSLVVITIADLVLWLAFKQPVRALTNQIGAMIISQVHISFLLTEALKAVMALEGIYKSK